MVFAQRNYVFLAVAVAAIVVGFALMRIENEVNGFISLYVSPIIILAGYLGIIYAILWRPRRTREDAPEPATSES